MPLFEYNCVDCGLIFEKIEPRYSEASPFCQRCGGLTERLISLPAFHDFSQTMAENGTHRPYVTRNIDPSGKPLEIRSHQQLKDACRRSGVIHVPDKHSRIG